MLLRFDLTTDKKDDSPQLLYFIRDDCFYMYDIRTSAHNIAEFIFVLNGTGNAILENRVYPLTSNTFYIIDPYVSHGEFLKKGQGFTYFIIGVKNFSYRVDADETEESNLTVPQKLFENDPIALLLAHIFRELSEKRALSQEAVEHYFRLLMIEIERRHHGKITQSDSKYSATIGKVKLFIDTHLYGDISPYFVSEHFGYVHNTLTKKFKKEVGVSIQHYIILKRIEASKKNLENSGDSISQIATMVGFDNPSYFSQIFKQIVGCSPNEYRQKVKK